MFLIFDTETTGLPLDKNAPLTNFDNWPRMVQIAWQIHDEKGNFISAENHTIKPEGFVIPINASMVHGITTEHAMKVGENLEAILDLFLDVIKDVKYIVGHNVRFDLNIVACEYLRIKGINPFRGINIIDTCSEKTADFCKLAFGNCVHNIIRYFYIFYTADHKPLHILFYYAFICFNLPRSFRTKSTVDYAFQ